MSLDGFNNFIKKIPGAEKTIVSGLLVGQVSGCATLDQITNKFSQQYENVFEQPGSQNNPENSLSFENEKNRTTNTDFPCEKSRIKQQNCGEKNPTSFLEINPEIKQRLNKLLGQKQNLDHVFSWNPEFDGSKVDALVIIDWQKGFYPKIYCHELWMDYQKTEKAILKRISEAKKTGIPLIVLTFRGKGPVLPVVAKAIGNPAFQVEKKTNGVFDDPSAGPKLNAFLKDHHLQNVRVTGINDQYCVYKSVQGFVANGYNVVINDHDTTLFELDSSHNPNLIFQSPDLIKNILSHNKTDKFFLHTITKDLSREKILNSEIHSK